MRRVSSLAALAGLLVTLSVVAQPPGRGFGRGMGGGGAMLMVNKSVQEELKFTDEQKTKVKDYGEKQMARMRESFGQLKNLSDEERREKGAAMAKKSAEEAQKFMDEVLTADQKKRFKEIERQVAGIGAFSEKDVQEALKLTDEQKGKIEGIVKELGEDTRALFQQGGGRDVQTKMTALRKEATEKATELLTAEQKTSWKELTGKPFNYVAENPFGGGFGKRKKDD